MIKKSIYIYSGYGIIFDRSSWSFSNGTARNVIIFDADNSSSSHVDNRKKNFLILGLGPTHGINARFVSAKKKINILLNPIQNFTWIYIIMLIIVICLLMEKK